VSNSSLYHDLPSNCLLDVDQVENGLASLKGIKSIGPDVLSGDFLYAIRSSLCFSIWLLFCKSLDSGAYPEILKLNSITPVFKSSDLFDVQNY